ncbi:short-chain dehydrogenase [Burkholderia singularis]|uniref:Short-chain dehydrogenase n=1 Tax=Burkholderia singularis TaxID=1503053 RepID=A0A103E584_9BURK|nr:MULTISPECIES: SDR family oxidoreductase [Burkholderia]AOK31567.1 short-chain dehydrogenase [Burkholderia sp. Bp7605]KVE28592.1 short-chain dehydrogenase [Burkholderia singularis]
MQPLSNEAPRALFDAAHTETSVPAGDVTLAAKTWGDASRPAVVLVHGYPDNSSVWHGVASILAQSYYVIAYDVRGAGLSSAPQRTADYRLEKLVDDFAALIDALAPNRAVHVIGHDWGSIQGWEFVTEPRLAGRILSYTSCSGPNLDHVGYWMRHQLAHPSPASLARIGNQLVRSWYVYLFHLPLLPELSWRLWLARAWPALLRRIERTTIEPRPTQADDGAHGVRLYRANFIRRLFAPRERYAHAPVQVIVPLRDKYVSPALSADLARWVPHYYRREVAERHWMPVDHPERFATIAQELIEAVETGTEPPALAHVRRRNGTGPFSGKLVVITGAGSGIGRSAAVEFAKQGASIVAVDIDEQAAERTVHLVQLLGADAHARRVDVGSPDEMEALANWVENTLGGADIVVNNAGIGMAGGILDTSAAHWERILRVNLWGVIHGSRLFAKQMAARGAGGHIVNTASAAAFGPSRDLPAYATTKAAVLMLSECMRAELADHGIGVSAVCPGFAETGIMAATQYAGASEADEAKLRKRATKLYQMRGLKPETVAKAIAAAVLQNKPVVAIGAEAHAMRFVGRYMPWLGRMIARVSMASH